MSIVDQQFSQKKKNNINIPTVAGLTKIDYLTFSINTKIDQLPKKFYRF